MFGRKTKATAKAALDKYTEELMQWHAAQKITLERGPSQLSNGLTGIRNSLGAPAQAAPAVRAPTGGSFVELQKVGEMLGIDTAGYSDTQWGGLVTQILLEIVQRSGIQVPIRRPEDLIGAIVEARGE